MFCKLTTYCFFRMFCSPRVVFQGGKPARLGLVAYPLCGTERITKIDIHKFCEDKFVLYYD